MTTLGRQVGRRRAMAGLVTGAALLALGGCQTGGAGSSAAHAAKPTDLRPFTGLAPGAPAVTFPAYVTAAVRDGYQFALERPDVLQVLPCYCGCGLTSAHRHNLDCFIAGARPDGAVVFDEHASFCQTCLDIARDAKRLVAAGKSLREIRVYVDEQHREKGPGTDTPPPA